jgi:protein SSD1
LRLFFQLDDENVPVEDNLFNNTPSHEIIEELTIKANTYVGAKLLEYFPEKALLRRQAVPMKRRLDTFADRMKTIGYDIDISSSAALQKSLFSIQDEDIRKVSHEVSVFR